MIKGKGRIDTNRRGIRTIYQVFYDQVVRDVMWLLPFFIEFFSNLVLLHLFASLNGMN
jgi:hypothetical protein